MKRQLKFKLENDSYIVTEDNSRFEDVEDLIIVFNELTAAKGIRLTNEFKLGILREIIERNHKYADKIETKDDNIGTLINKLLPKMNHRAKIMAL